MPPFWKQSSCKRTGGFPPWELQVPAGCLGDKTEEKREIIENRRFLPLSVSIRRDLSWSSWRTPGLLTPLGVKAHFSIWVCLQSSPDVRWGTKDRLSTYFKFSSFPSICLVLFSFQSSQIAAIFILSRFYSYIQWGKEKQVLFYNLNTWKFKYLLILLYVVLCVKMEKLLLCCHPQNTYNISLYTSSLPKNRSSTFRENIICKSRICICTPQSKSSVTVPTI